ncbi:MAG: hypothetical protein ER33_04865 [Cyanobium sp. CACIAM 14]|nr:MAG: hypothetical protein ER33_04865 [Cyanobium sp. CACIAM 14]
MREVAMTRTQPVPVADAQLVDTCMGITCLQWEKNGDLAEADRQTLLARLCRTDPQACAVLEPAQRPCARVLWPEPTLERPLATTVDLTRWSG